MTKLKGFIGKNRLGGLTQKTVEEVAKIRDMNYGISYDCVHAAASVSRIFGRFVNYVQFETPKRPAYLIVLNFPEENLKDTHNGLTGIAMKYVGRPFKAVMPDLLDEMGNCDGAVLVDNKGKILRVGAQLTNLDTRKLLRERKKEFGNLENPALILGFGVDVGTRHTTALVASHKHEGSKVITLSEESGDIRVYSKGKIISTTNEKDRLEGIRRRSLEVPSPFERMMAVASI
ncbi:DNA integrity scanning protein DisA nucleotide-binding domain protein [Candidatus Woesearchaeota archaeon]|nr:DNA integrity scanning protein DisA nucleotide-binding domain protein [Candidatus Woesearchaeota archaeon]